MVDLPGNARECLDALRETAHKLSAVLDQQETLDILLQQLTAAVGADKALALLIAPDAKHLVVSGSLGLSEAYLSIPQNQSMESVVNRSALAGQTVILSHWAESTEQENAIAGENLPGLLCFPFAVREHIIGVLHIYVSADRVREEETLIFLNILVDLGALALERVRLQQSLYHIAAALNSSLELRSMLQQVLERTVEEMWLKAASIRLLDADRHILQLVAAHGLSEQYLSKGEVHPAKSEIDRKVLSGEIVIVEDLQARNCVEYPQEALDEGIRSLMVVPLYQKGRVVGVLRVYSAQPRQFRSVAQDFLKMVADLIGLAIENAELYGALKVRFQDLKVDLADWHRFLALG